MHLSITNKFSQMTDKLWHDLYLFLEDRQLAFKNGLKINDSKEVTWLDMSWSQNQSKACWWGDRSKLYRMMAFWNSTYDKHMVKSQVYE